MIFFHEKLRNTKHREQELKVMDFWVRKYHLCIFRTCNLFSKCVLQDIVQTLDINSWILTVKGHTNWITAQGLEISWYSKIEYTFSEENVLQIPFSFSRCSSEDILTEALLSVHEYLMRRALALRSLIFPEWSSLHTLIAPAEEILFSLRWKIAWNLTLIVSI